MYIMSQDELRLVNSDYVKQCYIEKIHEGARLIAETDTSIIQLGTYDNIDHTKRYWSLSVFAWSMKTDRVKLRRYLLRRIWL